MEDFISAGLFNLMLTSQLGVIWLPHTMQPSKLFPEFIWLWQNTLMATAAQRLHLFLGRDIFF